MEISQLQVKAMTQAMFVFERRGEYARALEEVKNIWEDMDTFPNVEGLNSLEAAEIILRCGSLIGFEGHIKQIPNAQEKSKNLLTEALERFIALEIPEKLVECENYLALAYWRTGELVEAETWIKQSLLRRLPSTHNVGLHSKIIKCLILLANKNYEKIIVHLQNEEKNFLGCSDNGLKGDFYNNYAIALQELGQTSQALQYSELARFYHQKSGNQIYLATVENNLAQLYKLEKRFTQAHEAIDRALEINKKLEDRTREGFTLDTKAQIYFDEKKYEQALITVETALAIMQKSENMAYLVETLWTKTKILIYLNNLAAATKSLFEATRLAEIHISEEAANNLLKDFETTLHEKTSFISTTQVIEPKRNEETLELVLPPTIAHYHNVQGVRMRNSHLEKYDLPIDSLAIVVEDKIRRGDLVAVTEIATDSVVCGFYDSDFGIVCLENGEGEPTLFDESDIKILGKIIGVCNEEKTSDGKMLVKPLNLSR